MGKNPKDKIVDIITELFSFVKLQMDFLRSLKMRLTNVGESDAERKKRVLFSTPENC